jgi:carbonic anhydrase
MTSIDVLLKRNEELGNVVPGDRSSPQPSLNVAILTCMDARVRVFEIFGLIQGESHVLRNAGGVVTDDVIRSLAISQRKLNTRDVMLIHHTDCGMQKITDQGFADQVEEASGQRPEWSAGAFEDVEEDLRASRRAIEESPFVPRSDAIRAYVYEVETGRIREIA